MLQAFETGGEGQYAAWKEMFNTDPKICELMEALATESYVIDSAASGDGGDSSAVDWFALQAIAGVGFASEASTQTPDMACRGIGDGH